MMKASEIRQKYLDYFKSKAHKFQESASLVPDDPTMLLTIAGMVPFKPYFLGKKDAPFTRATSCQKCIRTNDLDNVGKTPRHHTFFEMLGNFSFGDYFKKEAIGYAWDFLTEVLSLDKDKLYISVFTDDDEAIKYWKSETDVADNRIVKLGEEHNFWKAGPTGPCGPCSEIYYDTGEDANCPDKANCAPGCDCNRFLEIWNLVFMQYDRDDAGKLSPLPKQNIDTGMGLERITTVIQNAESNFDTDLFTPVIAKIKSLAKEDNKESMQVIADHIRAITFLIADNVFPGNEGRGYVLKKILRRAILHGKNIGIESPFMNKLSDKIIQEYGDFYKELKNNSKIIKEVIDTEEKNFSKTLGTGLQLLEDVIKANNAISGEHAFKLFDTYGFPLELTQDIAREKNVKIDVVGFQKLMTLQKERSRENSLFYKDGEKPVGGEAIIAENDKEKNEMARNHSATHLLQDALKKVLGTHVSQAGSMVSPDRLRFDFTTPKALTEEQIAEAERLTNKAILENHIVNICSQSYQEAIDGGAVALFTEKYGDDVRVVTMGDSKELCGGTHVERTGDIGLLKIVSESSISSGIRRVEALTGSYALEYLNNNLKVVKTLSAKYKIPTNEIETKINDLQSELDELKKQNSKIMEDILVQKILDSKTSEKLDIDSLTAFVSQIDINEDIKIDLKGVANKVQNKIKGTVCIFINNKATKRIQLIVKTEPTVSANRFSAGAMIKEIAPIMGGKGGGKPDLAQGSGSLPEKLNEAKEKAISYLKYSLGANVC